MLNPNKPLLQVSTKDQYRTIDELFEQSKPSPVFYLLLLLSVLIVTPGLILGNASIVIGGMLVAPILTPFLTLGLGLAVGEQSHLKPVAILMLKSFGIILGISFIMSTLFGPGGEIFFGYNSATTAFLYFLIAVVSGAAAALAKAHKEISELLPGVGIAISVVTPLCLVGIWLADWELGLARFYFYIFVLNVVGITLGSLIVFSMLKFYKADQHVKDTAIKVEEETAKKTLSDS